MAVSDHKCLACGAPLNFNPKSQSWICEYCGTEFKIEHKDHKQLYKENPSLIKPRYIYRKFNIDIPTLRKAYHEFIQSSIELNSALNDRKFSFAFKSGYASANAIILHIFYTFIIK